MMIIHTNYENFGTICVSENKYSVTGVGSKDLGQYIEGMFDRVVKEPLPYHVSIHEDFRKIFEWTYWNTTGKWSLGKNSANGWVIDLELATDAIAMKFYFFESIINE